MDRAINGAFERFLTSAIATIITIVFSWRILLEIESQRSPLNPKRALQTSEKTKKEEKKEIKAEVGGKQSKVQERHATIDESADVRATGGDSGVSQQHNISREYLVATGTESASQTFNSGLKLAQADLANIDNSADGAQCESDATVSSDGVFNIQTSSGLVGRSNYNNIYCAEFTTSVREGSTGRSARKGGSGGPLLNDSGGVRVQGVLNTGGNVDPASCGNIDNGRGPGEACSEQQLQQEQKQQRRQSDGGGGATTAGKTDTTRADCTNMHAPADTTAYITAGYKHHDTHGYGQRIATTADVVTLLKLTADSDEDLCGANSEGAAYGKEGTATVGGVGAQVQLATANASTLTTNEYERLRNDTRSLPLEHIRPELLNATAADYAAWYGPTSFGTPGGTPGGSATDSGLAGRLDQYLSGELELSFDSSSESESFDIYSRTLDTISEEETSDLDSSGAESSKREGYVRAGWLARLRELQNALPRREADSSQEEDEEADEETPTPSRRQLSVRSAGSKRGSDTDEDVTPKVLRRRTCGDGQAADSSGQDSSVGLVSDPDSPSGAEGGEGPGLVTLYSPVHTHRLLTLGPYTERDYIQAKLNISNQGEDKHPLDLTLDTFPSYIGHLSESVSMDEGSSSSDAVDDGGARSDSVTKPKHRNKKKLRLITQPESSGLGGGDSSDEEKIVILTPEIPNTTENMNIAEIIPVDRVLIRDPPLIDTEVSPQRADDDLTPIVEYPVIPGQTRVIRGVMRSPTEAGSGGVDGDLTPVVDDPAYPVSDAALFCRAAGSRLFAGSRERDGAGGRRGDTGEPPQVSHRADQSMRHPPPVAAASAADSRGGDLGNSSIHLAAAHTLGGAQADRAAATQDEDWSSETGDNRNSNCNKPNKPARPSPGVRRPTTPRGRDPATSVPEFYSGEAPVHRTHYGDNTRGYAPERSLEQNVSEPAGWERRCFIDNVRVEDGASSAARVSDRRRGAAEAGRTGEGVVGVVGGHRPGGWGELRGSPERGQACNRNNPARDKNSGSPARHPASHYQSLSPGNSGEGTKQTDKYRIPEPLSPVVSPPHTSLHLDTSGYSSNSPTTSSINSFPRPPGQRITRSSSCDSNRSYAIAGPSGLEFHSDEPEIQPRYTFSLPTEYKPDPKPSVPVQQVSNDDQRDENEVRGRDIIATSSAAASTDHPALRGTDLENGQVAKQLGNKDGSKKSYTAVETFTFQHKSCSIPDDNKQVCDQVNSAYAEAHNGDAAQCDNTHAGAAPTAGLDLRSENKPAPKGVNHGPTHENTGTSRQSISRSERQYPGAAPDHVDTRPGDTQPLARSGLVEHEQQRQSRGGCSSSSSADGTIARRKSSDFVERPCANDVVKHVAGKSKSCTARATSTALAHRDEDLTDAGPQAGRVEALVSAVASAQATGSDPYTAVARASARAATVATASAAQAVATRDPTSAGETPRDISCIISTSCSIQGDDDDIVRDTKGILNALGDKVHVSIQPAGDPEPAVHRPALTDASTQSSPESAAPPESQRKKLKITIDQPVTFGGKRQKERRTIECELPFGTRDVDIGDLISESVKQVMANSTAVNMETSVPGQEDEDLSAAVDRVTRQVVDAYTQMTSPLTEKRDVAGHSDTMSKSDEDYLTQTNNSRAPFVPYYEGQYGTPPNRAETGHEESVNHSGNKSCFYITGDLPLMDSQSGGGRDKMVIKVVSGKHRQPVIERVDTTSESESDVGSDVTMRSNCASNHQVAHPSKKPTPTPRNSAASNSSRDANHCTSPSANNNNKHSYPAAKQREANSQYTSNYYGGPDTAMRGQLLKDINNRNPDVKTANVPASNTHHKSPRMAKKQKGILKNKGAGNESRVVGNPQEVTSRRSLETDRQAPTPRGSKMHTDQTAPTRVQSHDVRPDKQQDEKTVTRVRSILKNQPQANNSNDSTNVQYTLKPAKEKSIEAPKEKQPYSSVLQTPVENGRTPQSVLNRLQSGERDTSQNRLKINTARKGYFDRYSRQQKRTEDEQDAEFQSRRDESGTPQLTANRASNMVLVDIDIDSNSSKARSRSASRVEELKKRLENARPKPPPESYVDQVWNAGAVIASRSQEIGLNRVSGEYQYYTASGLESGMSTPSGDGYSARRTKSMSGIPSHFFADENSFVSLVETDLDTGEMSETPLVHETDLDGAASPRSRSMVNLADGKTKCDVYRFPDNFDRHQSLGILSNQDKDVAVGDSNMSEHERRVAKSIDKLDIPDWYKSSPRKDQEIVILEHARPRPRSPSPSGWAADRSEMHSSRPIVIQHRVVASHGRMRSPTPSSQQTPDGPLEPFQLPSEKLRQNTPSLLKQIEMKPFDKLGVNVSETDQPKRPAKEAYLRMRERAISPERIVLTPASFEKKTADTNTNMTATEEPATREIDSVKSGPSVTPVLSDEKPAPLDVDIPPPLPNKRHRKQPLGKETPRPVSDVPQDALVKKKKKKKPRPTSAPIQNVEYTISQTDPVQVTYVGSQVPVDGPCMQGQPVFSQQPAGPSEQGTRPHRSRTRRSANKNPDMQTEAPRVSDSGVDTSRPWSAGAARKEGVGGPGQQVPTGVGPDIVPVVGRSDDTGAQGHPLDSKPVSGARTQGADKACVPAAKQRGRKARPSAPAPAIPDTAHEIRSAHQPIKGAAIRPAPAGSVDTSYPDLNGTSAAPVLNSSQQVPPAYIHDGARMPLSYQQTSLTGAGVQAGFTQPHIQGGYIPEQPMNTGYPNKVQEPVRPPQGSEYSTPGDAASSLAPAPEQTLNRSPHRMTRYEDSPGGPRKRLLVREMEGHARQARPPPPQPRQSQTLSINLSDYQIDPQTKTPSTLSRKASSLEEMLDGLLVLKTPPSTLMSSVYATPPAAVSESPLDRGVRLLRQAQTPSNIPPADSGSEGGGEGPDSPARYAALADPPCPLGPGEDVVNVKCRYTRCGKTATLREARSGYKTCHNCYTYYCSRECRRAHWERHKKKCPHSRLASACKHVIKRIHDDAKLSEDMTSLARSGYLSQGRGCILFVFSCAAEVDIFLRSGLSALPSPPTYISLPKLQELELLGEHVFEVSELCGGYNPEVKYVLEVCVVAGAVSVARPAPRDTGPVIKRCAKLRMGAPPARPPRAARPESDTLILTAVPGAEFTENMEEKKAREVCFVNIQRKLRQRGVSLRHQYPEVYDKLCAYVAANAHFTPITLFPVDATTGRHFMCLVMPDSEPETEWMSRTDVLDDIGLTTSV